MSGDVIQTGSVTVTVSMIDTYADLSSDRFEIHMDAEAAGRHGFAARVAHGILVQGLADGMKNTADAQLKARASLGWDVNFRAAALAGDTLSTLIRIGDIRPTSTAGQCVITLLFDVRNQDDILVMAGTNKLLAYL